MNKITKPLRLWEEPEKEYTVGTESDFLNFINEIEKRGELKPFKPSLYYNESGDGFEMVWDTDNYFGESFLDDYGEFTIYRSEENPSKIVGVWFDSAKRRMGLKEVTTNNKENLKDEQKD